MAYVISHVEVAETDRTVDGFAIGKGQAFIVSNSEFGTGTGGGAGDFVKIASFIGNEIRCYKMNETFATITGSDLATTASSAIVTSAATDWLNTALAIGDYLRITEGSDQGPYRVLQIAPDGNAAALLLECAMTTTASNLNFEVITATTWEPDYSVPYRAYPEPGSPLHRYRPYLGPGDHLGCNLQTTAGDSNVNAPGHDFGDADNPVPTGAYLEILQGADAGLYRIIAVFGSGLTLDTNMTASSPMQGLAYRVSLVSEHATTLNMMEFDTKNVLVGIHHDFNIKIVRAILTLNSALALDLARDLGTTEAQDLYEKHGQYLACYRLIAEPDPVDYSVDFIPASDDRVIIMAKPWRGVTVATTETGDQFDVRGQLFFTQMGLPIFVNDDYNPVLLLSWIGGQYRLKWAIGVKMVYEPPLGGICAFNP